MSNQPHIITTLLEKLDPTLEKMAERIFIDENKELVAKGFPERVQTEYNKEWTKLMLMRDITKSFSTYTKGTDLLCDNFTISGSSKGTLMITTNIMRDDVKYYLSTRVIYAGGYNIQCYHYRVITDSTLPKDGDKSKLNEILAKIKKMSKAEKIEKDIKMYEGFIKNYEQKISQYIDKTDEEILLSRKDFEKMSPYEELREDYERWERGVQIFHKQKNSKEEYEKIVKLDEKEFISRYKRINITCNISNKKSNEKSIEKLKVKLNSL